jgi:hypothetical protein
MDRQTERMNSEKGQTDRQTDRQTDIERARCLFKPNDRS